MYPVSDRFLQALRAPHRIRTEVTCTPPGGSPVAVRLTTDPSTVSGQVDSRIRRRASLSAYVTAAERDALLADGALYRIEHGIEFSNTDYELVPIFTGELVAARRSQGLNFGAATLPLQDLGAWLARCDFLTPYTVAAGTGRAAAISAMVTDARPGTIVSDTSIAGGTVGAATTFTDSRLDAITDLANDGNLAAYFDGAGTYRIENKPTTATRAALTLTQLIDLDRVRPLDRLYNTVIVSPSAVDGSQAWEPQVAQISDPAHPRHPSKIGVVPYRYASPTISTAADAARVASTFLDRVQGTTESLNLSAISNPALSEGDVIRIVSPATYDEPAATFQHFIDSFTLDLRTGEMTMQTRSQLEA